MIGITKRIVHNIWLGLESTVDDHVPLLGNQDLRQIADIYGRVILPLNSDIDAVRDLCIDFVDNFKTVYPDRRYMSINFHMLLHLTDQNIVSFGGGPASWCFPMESRNKQLKAIHTNGKSNLEFTLLKRHLIDAHLED